MALSDYDFQKLTREQQTEEARKRFAKYLADREPKRSLFRAPENAIEVICLCLFVLGMLALLLTLPSILFMARVAYIDHLLHQIGF